jgi:hypothetical protein
MKEPRSTITWTGGFLMASLIIVCLLLSSVAQAKGDPKKEIEWIITMPGLTQQTWNERESKLGGTFLCTGDPMQMMTKISEGLKSRGWSVSGHNNVTAGALQAQSQAIVATKGSMKLSLNMARTSVTGSILALGLKTGEPSTPVTGGGSSPSSGETGSGYREISGSLMDSISGNCCVAPGQELNLLGNLTGNLVVKKGAKANILGNVSGNITNYGTCNIAGNVTGNAINKGGSLVVSGKVSGKVEY